VGQDRQGQGVLSAVEDLGGGSGHDRVEAAVGFACRLQQPESFGAVAPGAAHVAVVGEGGGDTAVAVDQFGGFRALVGQVDAGNAPVGFIGEAVEREPDPDRLQGAHNVIDI